MSTNDVSMSTNESSTAKTQLAVTGDDNTTSNPNRIHLGHQMLLKSLLVNLLNEIVNDQNEEVSAWKFTSQYWEFEFSS